MIYVYTGTPGSGKSLHVIKDIVTKLKFGGNVICNFPVSAEKIKPFKKKKLGEFVYKKNSDLTVKFLVDYAKNKHVKGKEGQTLIIFDEAQAKFNSRDYRDSDRKEFNYFFTIHRHLGFNVILITQSDRLIDKQIRCLFEYEVKHRKINNFKFFRFIPIKTFACITTWYGVREKLGTEFFIYKKSLSDMYDSYSLFDIDSDKDKDKESKLSINTIKKEYEKENATAC